MRQETAVDGFRLAYKRLGPGPGKPATLTWLDDVGHFSPVEAPDAYAAAITAALA